MALHASCTARLDAVHVILALAEVLGVIRYVLSALVPAVVVGGPTQAALGWLLVAGVWN